MFQVAHIMKKENVFRETLPVTSLYFCISFWDLEFTCEKWTLKIYLFIWRLACKLTSSLRFHVDNFFFHKMLYDRYCVKRREEKSRRPWIWTKHFMCPHVMLCSHPPTECHRKLVSPLPSSNALLPTPCCSKGLPLVTCTLDSGPGCCVILLISSQAQKYIFFALIFLMYILET